MRVTCHAAIARHGMRRLPSTNGRRQLSLDYLTKWAMYALVDVRVHAHACVCVCVCICGFACVAVLRHFVRSSKQLRRDLFGGEKKDETLQFSPMSKSIHIKPPFQSVIRVCHEFADNRAFRHLSIGSKIRTQPSTCLPATSSGLEKINKDGLRH